MKTKPTPTVIVAIGLAVLMVVFLVLVWAMNKRSDDSVPVKTYHQVVPHQAQFVSKCIRLTGHTSIWCLNWLEQHN